jgi:(p)ppGpp synthase/HD superfamily hydrolase
MILSSRYREALDYTFALHREQLRSGSDVPYLAHLLGVSSLALEYGADEDSAIAALLHDAVEDQGGEPTLAEIDRRFGPKVSAIVAGCTDSLEEPKLRWRERKARYLTHLRNAAPEVQLVSVCDKLYNLRTIVNDYRSVGDELFDRFSGKREGVAWYYRALGETYTLRSPAVDEFQRVLAEFERLLAGGS